MQYDELKWTCRKDVRWTSRWTCKIGHRKSNRFPHISLVFTVLRFDNPLIVKNFALLNLTTKS